MQSNHHFNTYQDLQAHLHKEYTNNHTLLPSSPLEEQKGYTCKIIAIANLLKYHYKLKNIQTLPLPVYKEKKHTLSARKVAKDVAGSSIGELFTAQMIMSFVKGLGMAMKDETVTNADVSIKRFNISKNDVHATQHYINCILDSINKKNPPIVYFDAEPTEGPEHGLPKTNGNGSNEHAALVIGYCAANNGNISFILAHWEKYFIVDSLRLALSAAALETYRTPTTYYKVKTDKTSYPWSPNLSTLTPFLTENEQKELTARKFAYKRGNTEYEAILLDEKRRAKFNHKAITVFKRKSYQPKEKELGLQSTICIITHAKKASDSNASAPPVIDDANKIIASFGRNKLSLFGALADSKFFEQFSRNPPPADVKASVTSARTPTQAPQSPHNFQTRNAANILEHFLSIS